MNTPISAELLEELRTYIDNEVAGGFTPENAIVADALDVLSDECEPHRLRPHARQYLGEALHAHKQAEARWPATTDCDRLDRAFLELETRGVVARQNYSCCGTCGVGEVFDEIDDAQQQGRTVHGYTFYHMQDTEHAVAGCGLYLNYGATADDEAPALAVGRLIAKVLTRHGLHVEWDETWSKRIHVKLDWKRRRFMHVSA